MFLRASLKHIKANLHLSEINARSSGLLGSKIKPLHVSQLWSCLISCTLQQFDPRASDPGQRTGGQMIPRVVLTQIQNSNPSIPPPHPSEQNTDLRLDWPCWQNPRIIAWYIQEEFSSHVPCTLTVCVFVCYSEWRGNTVKRFATESPSITLEDFAPLPSSVGPYLQIIHKLTLPVTIRKKLNIFLIIEFRFVS